jgi:hypothetical protein
MRMASCLTMTMTIVFLDRWIVQRLEGGGFQKAGTEDADVVGRVSGDLGTCRVCVPA